MTKPRLGVFGLTGCAGDQLVLLDCEDELLDLVARVDLRDFLMASTGNDEESRLDVALVEGAVLSRRDEASLRRIRERSDVLVALGTCAVWGGVPVLDRGVDRPALQREIYGAAGDCYDALPARALHEVVPVDLAITGCPVEKDELLAALASLLHGDAPLPPTWPVCAECKAREVACVLAKPDAICCGPVTAGGCHARCTALGVPCLGCRGPSRDANVGGFFDAYGLRGAPLDEVVTKLGTFAPPLLPPPAARRLS